MNTNRWKRVKAVCVLTQCVLVAGFSCLAYGWSFEKTPMGPYHKMVSDYSSLTKVAQKSSDYLKNIHLSKYVTADVGLFKKYEITLEDVKVTLDFVAKVAQSQPHLLQEHSFYDTYFDCYRWYTDKEDVQKIGTLPRGWTGSPECIRVTTYRITPIHASSKKIGHYTYPLYALPSDEKGLVSAQVKNNQNQFARFKYTLAQILEGAFEKSSVTQPIAWVKECGYKELAMQGTALLVFHHSGEQKRISVAGNNGKDGEEKYWFSTLYQEKDSKKFPVKVDPIAGVSFAGNMEMLGFGKLIAVVGKNPHSFKKEMRLGVLVDTGAAFKDNLCKLDLFVGPFDDHHLFLKHCKQYPHTAQAYILIKKKNKTL